MNSKDGFTLVELSIVLVIVGLLIGGILVAQSMVDTAKLSSAIKALQQYDTAFANFQAKYNSVPGDSVSFGGNGNGYIEDSTGLLTNFDNEIANYWPNLNSSGFDPGITYTSTITGSFDYKSITARNAPEFPYGKSSSVIVYSDTTALRTKYLIGNNDATTALAISQSASFTPQEAKSLDVKIDDGLRASGIVVGMGNPGQCQPGAAANPAFPYYITYKYPGCVLYISVGKQVGL